ncbi:unnamed protein product, partial [Hapterophycus canaliculatus]
MQENAFISDFFGCVGFLPLTNESEIREAVVKIMVSPISHQEPALSPDCFGEDGHCGTVLGRDTFNNVSGMNRLPKDPSFCAFW